MGSATTWANEKALVGPRWPKLLHRPALQRDDGVCTCAFILVTSNSGLFVLCAAGEASAQGHSRRSVTVSTTDGGLSR
jgi:hypothetical protein